MGKEQSLKEHLIARINEVTAGFHPRDYGKHKIMILEGITERLEELADACSECSHFIHHFEEDIINKLVDFDNTKQREYHLNLKKILSHLKQKHKVVTRGHYTELYMSIGIVSGFMVGVVMGNLGIGFTVGICAGLAVGAGLDVDAKRKGNVILPSGQ